MNKTTPATAEPLARTLLGVPEDPAARDAVRNVEAVAA